MTFDATDPTFAPAAGEQMPPADDAAARHRRLMRDESDEIDGSLCDLPHSEAHEAITLRTPPR